jgi:hypothetical protein
MKKIIYTLLLLVLQQTIYAQVVIALLFGDKLNSGKLEFGITVGPSLTNITGIEGDAKAGLNLGLYFNIKINDRLFIHPEGIAKGSFGARNIQPYGTGNDSLDQLFAGGDVKRKIGALSLPILLRYNIKGKWFAEAGPQVDLLLKPKDIFTAKVNDNDLTYTTDIRDEITRLDLGLAAGLIYKLKKDKGMGLGIRYYYGLTDIQKNITGNQRNTVWQLNVTIPIGAGKPNPPAASPPQ